MKKYCYYLKGTTDLVLPCPRNRDGHYYVHPACFLAGIKQILGRPCPSHHVASSVLSVSRYGRTPADASVIPNDTFRDWSCRLIIRTDTPVEELAEYLQRLGKRGLGRQINEEEYTGRFTIARHYEMNS